MWKSLRRNNKWGGGKGGKGGGRERRGEGEEGERGGTEGGEWWKPQLDYLNVNSFLKCECLCGVASQYPPWLLIKYSCRRDSNTRYSSSQNCHKRCRTSGRLWTKTCQKETNLSRPGNEARLSVTFFCFESQRTCIHVHPFYYPFYVDVTHTWTSSHAFYTARNRKLV